VGLYAFTRDALARIATLPPCELEERERLEQLRWLAHGLPIQVGHTPFETPCIDTPDDLKKLHAGPPPP
jgi:3-deoxy-manno-octulosonate cytidylyltransferase (CMP-KDO synthetase)